MEAQASIDEVIEVIKKSKDPETALQGLLARFRLTEVQAKAILVMQLQRITGLEVDKLKEYMGENESFMKVKIEDEEILTKGDCVMLGYYKNPEATAEVITKDGWFRTGDSGKIDEDGHLVIVDRIKDLFKTSNGKYIAPQQIETKLNMDPYIAQIVVIGDSRNFVTAIIVPELEALKEFASNHNIMYDNLDELFENQKVQKLVQP